MIDRQDTGAIKQYIKNLIDIGLIKRIKDYSKNRYYYFISSPIIGLYYYLDEKYFKERLGRHVEYFFRDLLEKIFKMRS